MNRNDDDALPTVLLVDDNPTNLQVLLSTLRDQGVKLIAATGGEQAIRLANKTRPDVILLDVMMPGLDGYETCQRLKAAEETRDIAIIFLTALTGTEEKVRGLSLGAADFITKPFEPAEVVARLNVQLNQQEERRALLAENRRLLERAAAAPAEPDRVRGLIDAGEGDRVEFKSTLRWSLKNDQADRGVEMAWLKTIAAFLNSDGGTLLIGVADDHEVLGHEIDAFQNEDKYLLHVNNRIQQHIGLSHAPSIRYALVPIDGKKVLVVDCTKAPEPVFLVQGKEESYYIRVGPGTRKLTMSQMLAHVGQRRKG